MPAFKDVLVSLASAWREQKDEIDRVGGQVMEYLKPPSKSRLQRKKRLRQRLWKRPRRPCWTPMTGATAAGERRPNSRSR